MNQDLDSNFVMYKEKKQWVSTLLALKKIHHSDSILAMCADPSKVHGITWKKRKRENRVWNPVDLRTVLNGFPIIDKPCYNRLKKPQKTKNRRKHAHQLGSVKCYRISQFRKGFGKV